MTTVEKLQALMGIVKQQEEAQKALNAQITEALLAHDAPPRGSGSNSS